MDVVKYIHPRRIGDLVAVEWDQNYSRERVTLLAGAGAIRSIPQFALVAALPGAGAVTSVAKPANIGNGVLGAVTGDANAPEGDYSIVIIEPGANAGAFEVVRPDGRIDGEGTVGVAYNGQINFNLADGAADFVAGDAFTVTVAYTADPKYVAWDPASLTGAQVVSGVCLAPANAADGVDDLMDVLVRGPVIIRKSEMAWPVGVTDTQKSAAYRTLTKAGIIPKVSG